MGTNVINGKEEADRLQGRLSNNRTAEGKGEQHLIHPPEGNSVISLPSTHFGSFLCLHTTAFARELIPLSPLTARPGTESILRARPQLHLDHENTTSSQRKQMSSSSMQPRDNPNLIYSSSLRATLLLPCCYPLVCGGTEEKGKSTSGWL